VASEAGRTSSATFSASRGCFPEPEKRASDPLIGSTPRRGKTSSATLSHPNKLVSAVDLSNARRSLYSTWEAVLFREEMIKYYRR